MQTRANWLIDVTMFISAAGVGLTSPMLFVPSGYCWENQATASCSSKILFEREIWVALHLRGSIIMALAVGLHLLIHRQWVMHTIKRLILSIKTGESTLSDSAKFNMLINALIAATFLVIVLSSLYLLSAEEINYQAGHRTYNNQTFLFSHYSWTMLHVWSASAMTAVAALHIIIHWGWVKKVTVRFFLSLLPKRNIASTG